MKYLSTAEFRDGGYLQEVNRRFFHPLGLALAIQWNGYTGSAQIEGVQDHRDDPEGVRFEFHDEHEQQMFIDKFEKVKKEWHARKRARVMGIGYMVQPVPEQVDELDSDIVELLANALAEELRPVLPVKQESQSWRKAARGILDKLSERINQAPYDPEQVTPEEVHIMDLVFMQAKVEGARTRTEALNTIVDQRNFYKATHETATNVLAAIAKGEELPNNMTPAQAADFALSEIAVMFGG